MGTIWSLEGLLSEADEALFQKKRFANALAIPTNELHFHCFLLSRLYSLLDLFSFLVVCKTLYSGFFNEDQ